MGLIVLLIAIRSRSSHDSQHSTSSASADIANTTVVPPLPYPPTEKAFISAVTSFVPTYNEAANELKKSALRTQRGFELRRALNDKRKFAGWVGRLTDMETTGDGKAGVRIQVARKLHLKTWNNELSDVGDRTLIEQSDPLYAAIADLKEGDVVQISGEFLPSRQDFIKETSLTEEGAMTDPEFLVRFSAIQKAVGNLESD